MVVIGSVSKQWEGIVIRSFLTLAGMLSAAHCFAEAPENPVFFCPAPLPLPQPDSWDCFASIACRTLSGSLDIFEFFGFAGFLSFFIRATNEA